MKILTWLSRLNRRFITRRKSKYYEVVTFGVIYKGVTEVCGEAKAKFGGECRGVLEKVLESEEFSYRERNKAIWALGQLADKQSLEVLNRIKGDREISQYELEKAIRWCKNGNVTSWMYGSL